MARSVEEQTGLPDVFGDGVFTPPIIQPGYSDPLEAGRASIEEARGKLSNAGPAAKAFEKFFRGISPQEKIKDAKKGATDLFMRGVFVATGALFVGVGLISLSRSASEGVIEGIAEGIKEGMK